MVRNVLSPPGVTTRVTARRVLVIAPHFDDEVLGCGGLIAQLAADGAEVGVLFLTDGSGGEENIADRPAYAARRHREAARALEILGTTDLVFADLPDGALTAHLDRAAAAIREALLERAPDLLLAISPLEISADHRAAFAALHAVLSPLRGGTDLDAAISDIRILLYEANHPAFPDLLVDVTGQLELIRRAIEAHASQLELHNYREMTLGLRSLRTASLSPAVQGAEGYRTLRIDDFRTASRAAMIRRLGGVPELHDVLDGPRISVVVRTRHRPQLLQEALDSLAGGTYRNVEVVLVNDGGAPPEPAEGFPFPLVTVNLPENRGRAAAANAGIASASGDWIAFLDDDDLAMPEHLATLAGLSRAAGARVVYTDAAVGIYELDAASGWHRVASRLPYSRDFDADLLLFDNYIPFNTLLIERSLLDEVGPLDIGLPFFEDWELLVRLSAETAFLHLPQVTAEYRHFRSGGQVFGERPDARADFLEVKARVIAKHRQRQSPEVVARVVDLLRAETVAAAEALRARSDELESERRRSAGERGELQAEIERHRRAAAEREQALHSLHAEIERLDTLIKTMESTKAWRLHRAVERLRGR